MAAARHTWHAPAAPQQAGVGSRQGAAGGSPLRADPNAAASSGKDVDVLVIHPPSANTTSQSHNTQDASAVQQQQQRQHAGSLGVHAVPDADDASFRHATSVPEDEAAEGEVVVTGAQLAVFRAEVAANAAWGRLQSKAGDDVRTASEVLLCGGTVADIPEWLPVS